MIAIYKKELKSYLTSMVGYLFMAVILLFFGIYFSAVNLQQAYPEIGYALSSTSFIFLIAVPVLTMRVMAEEQKNKTDQMLLTAPVKLEGIVLGKYLALLTVFAIPAVIICLYPLLMSSHGEISMLMSYNSILGFLLLGAAYIAIGVWISSITESQVIAAVISFVLLFACYVEEGIAGFFPDGAAGSFFALFVIISLVCMWIQTMIHNAVISGGLAVIGEGVLTAVYFLKSDLLVGKIQDLLGVFNISSYMDNFTNGIFDVQGIVYYLSVIAICMFLAVQSLQKRRWN